jgi:hypothetical protein
LKTWLEPSYPTGPYQTPHTKALKAKRTDPSAGFLFALIADVVDTLDKYELPLAQIKKPMWSIYHMANMFVYPLSYLLSDTQAHAQIYYDNWRGFYKQYTLAKDGYTHTDAFPTTLEELSAQLKQYYGPCYAFTKENIIAFKTLVSGKVPPKMRTAEDSFCNSFLCGKVADAANNEAIKYAQKLSRNTTLQAAIENYDTLLTLVLMVLLTPNANPRPAMGYQGVDQTFPGYHFVNQRDILADHSAMLTPSLGMMNKIYRKELMGEKAGSFTNFGKWQS